MNQSHREYQTFQKICKITGLDPGVAAERIRLLDRKETDIITTNHATDIAYTLSVQAPKSEHEYLVELRENHGKDGDRYEGRIIFRGTIRVIPPVIHRKKTAGLSGIVAAIMLISAAVVGSTALYASIQSQDHGPVPIQVSRFELVALGVNATVLHADLTVQITGDDLRLGGRTVSDTILYSDAIRLADSISTNTGREVSYTGILNLTHAVSPGDDILVDIGSGSHTTHRIVEVLGA